MDDVEALSQWNNCSKPLGSSKLKLTSCNWKNLAEASVIDRRNRSVDESFEDCEIVAVAIVLEVSFL